MKPNSLVLLLPILLSSCATDFSRTKGSVARAHILDQEIGDPAKLSSIDDKLIRYSRVAYVDVTARIDTYARRKRVYDEATYKYGLTEKDPKKVSELKDFVTKQLEERKNRLCFVVALLGHRAADQVNPKFWEFELKVDERALPVALVDAGEVKEYRSTHAYSTGGTASQIGSTVYYNPGTTTVYDRDNFSSDSVVCGAGPVDKEKIKEITLVFKPIYNLEARDERLALSWKIVKY
jgi:hypothetical protein